AVKGMTSSQQAAQQQAGAQRAAGQQLTGFYQDISGQAQPYIQAGYGALAGQQALAAQPLLYPPLPPTTLQQPGMQGYMQSPEYQSRVFAGQQALRAQQNKFQAAGMGLSGNQIKAAEQFSQDWAAQGYQQYLGNVMDINQLNYQRNYQAWLQN